MQFTIRNNLRKICGNWNRNIDIMMARKKPKNEKCCPITFEVFLDVNWLLLCHKKLLTEGGELFSAKTFQHLWPKECSRTKIFSRASLWVRSLSRFKDINNQGKQERGKVPLGVIRADFVYGNPINRRTRRRTTNNNFTQDRILVVLLTNKDEEKSRDPSRPSNPWSSHDL